MVKYATALRLGTAEQSRLRQDTLLFQQVLAEPTWASRLTDEDRRGLTALFWPGPTATNRC
jgi:hypothetical protein